jgi:hypothetical protein
MACVGMSTKGVKYSHSGPCSGGEAEKNRRINKFLIGRKNTVCLVGLWEKEGLYFSFVAPFLSSFLWVSKERIKNNYHALICMLRHQQKSKTKIRCVEQCVTFY